MTTDFSTSFICEWFAYCDNPATGTQHHPILGDVPICDRCRDIYERTER